MSRIRVVAGTKINRAKAYGRIAFAVPHAEQPQIKQSIIDTGNTILTDLITLDTPGKASVRVIILADPVNKLQYLFYQFTFR